MSRVRFAFGIGLLGMVLTPAVAVAAPTFHLNRSSANHMYDAKRTSSKGDAGPAFGASSDEPWVFRKGDAGLCVGVKGGRSACGLSRSGAKQYTVKGTTFHKKDDPCQEVGSVKTKVVINITKTKRGRIKSFKAKVTMSWPRTKYHGAGRLVTSYRASHEEYAPSTSYPISCSGSR